ncbi:MAG TPA: hypothetical protein VK034_26965, partial [Enhygromyxa sp.]|nr:hypothetical protein [Enhygromyxa sp.]
GPGWRIRANVFEGVHEPLRIEPLPGWRLVADDEIDPMISVSWGIGLVHDRHQIALYFRRPPLVSSSAGALESGPMVEAAESAPAMIAEFAGQQVQFEAYTGAAELIGATPRVHGHPLEIVGRYPNDGNRELMREHIREALAAIHVLDPGECGELRRDLERGASPRDLLGHDWSLRGDVYRNFEFAVRVRMSSPVLQVAAGVHAERLGNGVKLTFTDRGRRQRGELLAYHVDDTTPEAWHQHALGMFEHFDIDKHSPILRRQYGDATALVQQLENTREHWHVHIASVVDGRQALIMVLESFAEPKSDLAALATLEIDDQLERSRTVGGRYFDGHGGFAIDPPLPVPARHSDGDSTAFFFSHTQWIHGDQRVAVLVQNWEPIAGPMSEQLRAWMEVAEAEAAGRNPPEWIELTTPQPGRQLTWIDDEYHHSTALFVRDRTIYQLQVRSRGDRLFAQALASFELL